MTLSEALIEWFTEKGYMFDAMTPAYTDPDPPMSAYRRLQITRVYNEPDEYYFYFQGHLILGTYKNKIGIRFSPVNKDWDTYLDAGNPEFFEIIERTVKSWENIGIQGIPYQPIRTRDKTIWKTKVK
jgi:hypothetical protein